MDFRFDAMIDDHLRSTQRGFWLCSVLAGAVMLTSCQRQTVEPGPVPEKPAVDSTIAGADTAATTSTLVPLFGANRRYAGLTTVQAYVTAANDPQEAVDSIETLVWFHLNDQTGRTIEATGRVLMRIDSARTVSRGRSRLPRQQIMRGAVSYQLESAGVRTRVVPLAADSSCATGSLESMVSLQLPLPMISGTDAWSDSLQFVGCTSMIPTHGEAVVDYTPVNGSRSVVRRQFVLASEGAGIMDSIPVQLATVSHGSGRVALRLDSLGRVMLLSLADSITTELKFVSEFGTERFLQTALRTTEVVAAPDSAQR